MRTLLTLLFILIFCTGTSTTLGINQSSGLRAQRMLPVDSMGIMAEEIYQLIKDRHPSAFYPEGVAALDAARTQVLRDIAKAMLGQKDSIPYHEFVRMVSPLQKATQCGHLILEPYRDSLTDVRLRENYFGLLMMPVDSGQQYVLTEGIRTTSDSVPPGSFIRSVNGTSTALLIEQISRFSGANDQGNDYASKVLTAKIFSLQYQRYFDLQDSLILEIDPGTGQYAEHVLLPKHRPYKIARTKIWDINKILQFKLSDDGSTGVLTIKSFGTLKFHNGTYYKYISGVMDSLKRGNIRHLVIDLRGNTGGNSARINYLFGFLSKDKFQFSQRAAFTGPAQAIAGESEKDSKRREAGAVYRQHRKMQKRLTRLLRPTKEQYRYRGKVAVLIDEITFSASGMFARFVQGSRRGILVGTTAGASANVTYAAIVDDDQNFYGPRDDFRMRINGILLELPYPIPGNVTPDVTVTTTPEGLREGRDEVLEAAINALTRKGK